MVDLRRPIPSFHTTIGNITRLIVFTALFALVFINIYAPFGVESWYKVTRLQLLFYSSLVILTGVLVVVISRIIMYHYCKKHTLTLFQFIIWVIAEVFFMALFYSLFENLILSDKRSFETLLKNSILNTALVLLLPYAVQWLYFSWRDQKIRLEAFKEGAPQEETTRNMIAFNDERGVMQLSIKCDQLLFIEASGNYINIAYSHNNRIRKTLVRNTLKEVENTYSDSELIRCHRSYIVNFSNVKLMRKTKEGLVLELEAPEPSEIPVSKSYIEKVMALFSHSAGNN